MSASLLFLATRDSFVIASSEALCVLACTRARVHDCYDVATARGGGEGEWAGGSGAAVQPRGRSPMSGLRRGAGEGAPGPGATCVLIINANATAPPESRSPAEAPNAAR